MYLHEIANEELSFTRDDMHQGKHAEYERRLHQTLVSANGKSSLLTSQSEISGKSPTTNGKKITREHKESSPCSSIP